MLLNDIEEERWILKQQVKRSKTERICGDLMFKVIGYLSSEEEKYLIVTFFVIITTTTTIVKIIIIIIIIIMVH